MRLSARPLMRKAKRLSDLSRSPLIDYGLLLLLAVIFGSSFVMTAISVQEIPATTVVAGRLAIAAVILFVAMKLAGQVLPAFGRIWWGIVGAALFGNALPFFLISWGQVKVEAGLAAILMAIMPLVTLGLAHWFTPDEKLSLFKVIGFVLGVLGVVVLIGFDKLGTLGDQVVRQYAIALAAVCYAINAIITKKLLGVPRRAMVASLMIVSSLMTIPASLLIDMPWQLAPSDAAVGAVILAGIFPTVIGTLLIFAVIDRQGASFLSQINFLVPFAGVAWGMAWLSEELPANAWLSLFIILAGVAIARIGNKPVVQRRVA